MSENDNTTFGYNTNTNFVVLNEDNCNQPNSHEKPIKLIDEINEKFNFIKYFTYRTAAKFVELKKRFFCQHIPYKSVKGIFFQHKLNHNDNVPFVNREYLTAIVHDIFFSADKMGNFVAWKNFALDSATKTFVDFIFEIFNCHTELISPIELRQIFLLLCHTDTNEQLIFEHFTLCSDHNCSVTRYRFEAMTKVWSKIFAYIDNNQHYQSKILSEMIADCFEHCPGIVGLNEYQFNAMWLQQTSPTLFQHYSNVILLTKRMIDSEKIIHDIECVSCRKCSFEGLRFQCLQCSKISLCFNCFSIGFATKKHEPTHRMYEICSNEILRNKFMSFLTKLCNFFAKTSSDCRSSASRPNIVHTIEIDHKSSLIDDCCNNPADSIASKDSLGWLGGKTISPKKPSHHNDMDQLSIIIKMLSDERENIGKLVDTTNDECKNININDALKKHENILNNIISQLNLILKPTPSVHSSTPLRQFSATADSEKLNFGHSLTRSIAGADIHKSYFENNRSDLSIGDISSWLHTRKLQTCERTKKLEPLPTVSEQQSSNIDTEMCKFKELLNVVKDIIEGMLDDDSCSDNIEMSKATNELENVLDNIIGAAERKRL